GERPARRGGPGGRPGGVPRGGGPPRGRARGAPGGGPGPPAACGRSGPQSRSGGRFRSRGTGPTRPSRGTSGRRREKAPTSPPRISSAGGAGKSPAAGSPAARAGERARSSRSSRRLRWPGRPRKSRRSTGNSQQGHQTASVDCRLSTVDSSNQVNDREQDDPHEIDEVPVEAQRLDPLVARLGVLAEESLAGDEGHAHDPAEDVEPVKAGRREENRPEERDVRVEALVDELPELAPLVLDEVRR